MSGTFTEYSNSLSGSAGYRGLCNGPDGNIWFTELGSGSSRICKWNVTNGFTEYSTDIGSTDQPSMICAGPDGNLWFTYYNAAKIAKITTSGTVTNYSTTTTAKQALSIVSDGTNLWSTISVGQIVAKTTTAGVITEYAVGSSAYPRGLCIGPDGYVWICASGVDPNSTVNNSTTNEANSILKMNPADGTYSSYTVAGGSCPNYITAGSDGQLWFTRERDNKISSINTSGTITNTFTIPTGNTQPREIVQARDGRLWFCENISNKIGAVSLNGTFTEYTCPATNTLPYAIINGPGGDLFYTGFTYARLTKVTVDNPRPFRPVARQAVQRAATR